jgi:integrase
MVALHHRDHERAMREAASLAARRQHGLALDGPTTAGLVFALYLRASRGRQRAEHRAEVERAIECWSRVLGGAFDIRRFGAREWEDFIAKRSSGEVDPRGLVVTDAAERRPVHARQVAKDLRVLRAACRRATVERTPDGGFLLAADPTRGLALPAEKNPRRPLVDDGRVDRLLAVAGQVVMRVGRGRAARTEPSYLPVLLRLASDTGRRIGSILKLRWNDWRPDLGTYGRIRWRAEEDKVGREWWAPVTPAVRDTLEAYRLRKSAVGEVLLFPSPTDPTRPVMRQVADGWLRDAETRAQLERLPGGLWHPFRRRWATQRKNLSAKDVAAVGGWVDTATLQRCYQLADESTMEAVVLHHQTREAGAR